MVKRCCCGRPNFGYLDLVDLVDCHAQVVNSSRCVREKMSSEAENLPLLDTFSTRTSMALMSVKVLLVI